MRRINHLEAVTVCVGYDDFLKESIKFNQSLFDEWIIITDPTDEKTRELCRKHNLHCILSADGTKKNLSFSKGRLVERALQHTSADGHRLHIDADIILPLNFRKQIEASDLQSDMIYGIDRALIQSWDDWQAFLKTGYLTSGNSDYKSRVNFPKLPMGTRWVSPSEGYVPIGFFQLWHSTQDEWRGTRIKPYPTNHSTACRTDVRHALQWDRHKRALIPEVIGIHLESEPAPLGANWLGRKTKRFEAPDAKKQMETRREENDGY